MNAKKVAGIAVLKDAQGNMKGRIVSLKERDELFAEFGDRFSKPVPVYTNYTIGKLKSDTGIGFTTLPQEVIFFSTLTCPTDDCEFQVYGEAEPAEARPVIDALGGEQTFTEEVVQYGRMYSATYPGGSGSLCPLCL